MNSKQKTVRKIISLFCSITLLFSAAFVLNTDATVISEVVDGVYTETNEVLFDCGYDNAVTATLNSNLSPHYTNSNNFSGDLRAVNGCKTATEKYLWYAPSWYGLGVAVLGYDYSASGKQDTYAFNSAIKVRKGLTYKVEFDYLILGSFTQELQIGLAIGQAVNNFDSGSFMYHPYTKMFSHILLRLFKQRQMFQKHPTQCFIVQLIYQHLVMPTYRN